jgi:hypothetical protein
MPKQSTAKRNNPKKKAEIKNVQKKSSKAWLWLIFGCLGLVVIGVTIAVFLFVVVFKLFSGPIDQASDQLRLIRENKLSKAYDLGSNEFKKATNYDEFVQFVMDHPELSKNKSIIFGSNNIQGSNATLKGTIKSSDGTEIPVEYRLVKENGKWKVYYFTINPTGDIKLSE